MATSTNPKLNVDTSVVDYLRSQKQDSSIQARQKLAAEKGITNYTGSASQNTQLLGILKGTNAPASTTVPPTAPPPAASGTNLNSPITSSELEKASNLPEPSTLVNNVAPPPKTDKIGEMAKTVFTGNQQALDTLKKEQQDIVAREKEKAQQEVDRAKASLETISTSTQYADALAADRRKFEVDQKIQQLNEVNTKIVNAQDALNVGMIYEQGRPARLGLISGRQNTLKSQGLATIGALQGIASVLQGNIDLAKAYADDTISAIKDDNARSKAALDTLLNLANNNLVDLTKEERAIVDDRISKIDEEVTKIEKNKDDVVDLMAKYPAEALKAGITLLDSKDTAMEKILPFLSDSVLKKEYQLIDIGGRKKVYDPITQSIIKDLGPADDGSAKPIVIGTDAFGNNIYGVYNQGTKSFDTVSLPNSAVMSTEELDRAVLNALAGIKFPTNEARKSAQAQIRRLLAEGNTDEAKDFLKRQARNGLNGTQLDKITGKEDLLASIDSIENKLASFVAAGGDLNVFQGLSEKALEKGGFVKDPKLAQIANEIAIAIIEYRKAVTGAAFTESEKKSYDAVFPSIGKTGVLNQAKIDSLREVTTRQIDDFYKRTLGEENWNQLFSPTRTVPQLAPLNKSYTSIDTLLSEHKEYQSLYESILEADPSLTDDEVLQEIQTMAEDFTSESQTSLNGNNKILSPLAMSIVQQESGGRYDAVGSTTKYGEALGKYQIIPAFHFQKIGLNPNSAADKKKFLQTPALQDELFNKLITELDTRYKGNPMKIAAAYYGGHGAAQIVGTPAADKPQYAGGKQYPSINQYARSVVNRLA